MEREVIRHIFVIGTLAVGVAIILAIASVLQSNNSITGQAINAGDLAGSPYAYPVDVYDNSLTASVATTQASYGQPINVQVDIDHTGSDGNKGWIYHKYYVLRNSAWEEEILGPNTWIEESATGTIIGEEDIFPRTTGDDYVVAFWTCKWHDSAWRCGCRHTPPAAADCNHWMIQSDSLDTVITDQQYLSMFGNKIQVPGNSVAVDIIINGGTTNIYGFDFDIEYNENSMNWGQLEYATFLGSNGYPPNAVNPDFLCVSPTVTSGSVAHIACTRVGTTLPPAGSNILMRLRFNAITKDSWIIIKGAEIAKWQNVATPGTQPIISSIKAYHGIIEKT